MGARLVKVFHVRLNLREEAANGPHPLAALNREVGAARVLRDQKAGTHAPPPPQAKKPDDSAVVVLRDDKIVAQERGREPLVQTDARATAPPPERRKGQSNQDERLSIRTIAATMAAVIVLSFAFTALLPSILTRDGVEPAATAVTTPPPSQPSQIEQFGAVQPGPAPLPAQPPAPTPPAPASKAPTSVATTTPALRTTSVPSEKQAVRVTGADVPVSSAGKGAAKGRADLTAAEKSAVARGAEELKTTAAIAAPRRPAPARPALTDEEKAAVERGLRELEKTAGQGQP